MSLSISPSEKKAVIALLKEGGEGDTEEQAMANLASRIIHAVMEIRERRPQFIAVTEWKGACYFAFGPFSTQDAVAKALMDGRMPVAHFGKTASAQLYSADHWKETLDA